MDVSFRKRVQLIRSTLSFLAVNRVAHNGEVCKELTLRFFDELKEPWVQVRITFCRIAATSMPVEISTIFKIMCEDLPNLFENLQYSTFLMSVSRNAN